MAGGSPRVHNMEPIERPIVGVRYDSKTGYLCTALRIAHTVVPRVFRRPTFWFFVGVHFLIRGLHALDILNGVHDKTNLFYISWKKTGIICGLTSFFEVFYTNRSFVRYKNLYLISREIFCTLNEVIVDIRVHLGSVDMRHARLASRYVLCSVVAFFLLVEHQSASEQDFVDHTPVWAKVLRLELITRQEYQRLKQIPEDLRCLVLILWAADVTVIACDLGLRTNKLPQNLRVDLLERIVQIRSLQSMVSATIQLPVPYAYFHLLSMMIVVNLLIFAYGMGSANSALGTATFFFCSLIFMGMFELASELADPFGKDEADFPTSRWIANCINETAHVMERAFLREEKWSDLARCEQPLHALSVEVGEDGTLRRAFQDVYDDILDAKGAAFAPQGSADHPTEHPDDRGSDEEPPICEAPRRPSARTGFREEKAAVLSVEANDIGPSSHSGSVGRPRSPRGCPGMWSG